MSDPFGKTALMTETGPVAVAELGDRELLAATRELTRTACLVEADLLLHLGEIDERRLYLDQAFPSMFAFCVRELRFSEDVAYNRIAAARAGRRYPAVIEALRSGEVHLAGVRLLVPHFTAENHAALLAEAAGKSKREIEELVARFMPAPLPWRTMITPLTDDTFKVQFVASRRLRDKLREAQDLLRHRVPDGDLATVVEKAVDVLIEQVKKERFATGRKPRKEALGDSGETVSRHIPDAVKRFVYERDGGRCTFVDEQGRTCGETAALEFDHVDGFARTYSHEPDRIRLLCRAHNRFAAEQMYGRAFMREVGGYGPPAYWQPP